MARYLVNPTHFRNCTCNRSTVKRRHSTSEYNNYYGDGEESDREENTTIPAKPFLNSKVNNKPFSLDSVGNGWSMKVEFQILNGYMVPKPICIKNINVDTCPYVLPTLSSALFLKLEKIILSDTRQEEFCSILQHVCFRAGQSEYFLKNNNLGHRHENTLLIPLYSQLFGWLAKDTHHILERGVDRSINFGATIAFSEIDFELSKDNRVRIVVEVKDAKDPRCENIEVLLASSFLAIAQSQLHREEEKYNIYGITIIDFTFQFYETCISRKYLKDIGDACEPVEKLLIRPWLVEEQRKFSLIQTADRKIIIQLLKKMTTI